MLQRGMQESLAGRFQLLECPHWSFVECREAFDWTLDQFPFYGRLVENAVGAAFLNDADSVFYWSDRDKEVDFVVQRVKEILAIEVAVGG